MAYLNSDGLEYLLGKIKGEIDKKVEKEVGKGLSQEDFTTALKSKLENDVITETDLEDYIKNTDIASENDLGIIKIGSGLTIDQDGKVNVTNSITEIPIANDTTLGGIKVGDNLEITEDGTLSAVGGISDIPVATDETLGGIIVGDGLSVDENGKLDVVGGNGNIPLASDEIRGGIKIGEGVKVDTKTEKLSIDTNVTKYLVPITKAEYENIPDKENDTEHEYIIVDDDEYMNISADFLTEVGYGKLRFYQGKFQYLNTIRNKWIDISMDGNNPYIINMTPQAMKSFKVKFSYNDGKKFALKWEEPDDTIIEGQVACLIDKVVIRRKKDSVPLDAEDGIGVVTITRANFGMYKNNYFIDNTFVPNSGETWYYKAFPISSIGYINTSTANEDYATSRVGIVYGFHINGNESDPSTSVIYLEDAENMTPCQMGTNSFDYGSWENAFFMPKPCVLNDDGTVQCYLDKNDFTKKEDGISIVTDSSLNGEVMIEFPIIWYKFVEGTKDGEGYFYCSQTKIDDSYECWCNRDENGNITNHFYMAAYNGYIQSGKMRSVKGMTLTNSNSGKEGNGNSTVQIEVDSAIIHNPNGKHMWYTDVYCDRILIDALLVLIGKSLNTQKVFGRGLDDGGQTAKEKYVTGTLYDKGMFWGDTTAGTSAVKVFGIENFWGCVYRRTAGCTQTDGTYKVKLTYGTYDGTSVTGYNSDGTGYLRQGGLATTNGWAKTMKISNKFGFMPTTVGGANSTYYGDYYYYGSDTSYLLAGGSSGNGSRCGAFYLDLSGASSYAYWHAAAALSCKPTV